MPAEKCEYTKRHALQARLSQEANQKSSQIRAEIANYCPLGRMSDVAEVMGIKPKRGVAKTTPLGTVVFRKDNVPTLDTVQHWYNLKKETEEIRKEEAGLGWFACAVNTTIGNKLYMLRGKELDKKDLLEPDEKAFLDQLEKFWEQYPTARSGVVNPDGSIKPIDSD